jgi:hypothetical protein
MTGSHWVLESLIWFVGIGMNGVALNPPELQKVINRLTVPAEYDIM